MRNGGREEGRERKEKASLVFGVDFDFCASRLDDVEVAFGARKALEAVVRDQSDGLDDSAVVGDALHFNDLLLEIWDKTKPRQDKTNSENGLKDDQGQGDHLIARHLATASFRRQEVSKLFFRHPARGRGEEGRLA
jgi:hypothetical protein